MSEHYLIGSIVFTIVFMVGVVSMCIGCNPGLTLKDVMLLSTECGVVGGLWIWVTGKCHG